GTRQFLDHDRALEQRQPGAAIFLRHLHHPDAEILGALLEALQILGLDLLALRRDGLAFDRNELGVDEAPQRFLEHTQFFGQFEFHYVPPVRQITRTSTATAPLARTISGLISMSSIRAR